MYFDERPPYIMDHTLACLFKVCFQYLVSQEENLENQIKSWLVYYLAKNNVYITTNSEGILSWAHQEVRMYLP